MLFVAIGGAVGSLCRYGLSLFFPYSGIGFPYTTFAVNLLAAFLLGFLVGLAQKINIPPELRLALEVGFCGGFSTFSTFSKETFMLCQQQFFFTAFLYVMGSVLLGLLLFGLAYRAGSW